MLGWGPARIQIGNVSLPVGRDAGGGVCLSHPAVSRRHAELSRLADGSVFVRDLGSRAGVRVNGTQVQQHALKDGDRVEFGPVAYRYVHDELDLETLGGVNLEVRDLVVARSGSVLLSRVELKLLPNQFVGILGPSGAGKSTLLKCLASYFRPVSGKIIWDGQELTEVDRYRAIMGYVPQQDLLYELLTGRENLEFALRLQARDELRKRERLKEIGDIVQAIDMEGHADKPIAFLSGGQRKRFNVALGLLLRPRILFLDEPTSGLDPAAETRLMLLLQRVAAWGTTIACATHVLENLGLFDQVVIIADKSVVFAGPPGNILKHFGVDRFGALYVGLENGTLRRATAVAGPSALVQSDCGFKAIQTKERNTLAYRTQIATQVRRGLRLIGRDRFFLSMLLGQPVVIGFLVNLCLLRPGSLDPVFMFAVITSIWLGLNNTVREVVRDRTIYVRERLAGVTPGGYLASKVLLYGVIGLLQVVLLVAVIRYGTLLQDSYLSRQLATWPVSYVTAVLWLTYLSGMTLGLLISTIAKTQEVAVAWLPIVILPQLLLTKVVTNLNDNSFSSLVVFFRNARKNSRGFWRWVLEGFSMPMYSRPALCLFQEGVEIKGVVRLVDWMHLVLLLLITGTILLAVFRRQEQTWLERA